MRKTTEALRNETMDQHTAVYGRIDRALGL